MPPGCFENKVDSNLKIYPIIFHYLHWKIFITIYVLKILADLRDVIFSKNKFLHFGCCSNYSLCILYYTIKFYNNSYDVQWVKCLTFPASPKKYPKSQSAIVFVCRAYDCWKTWHKFTFKQAKHVNCEQTLIRIFFWLMGIVFYLIAFTFNRFTIQFQNYVILIHERSVKRCYDRYPVTCDYLIK